MLYETSTDNLEVLLKKFARDHDSNFLSLYGWGGKIAEPCSWSNAYVNGMVKTSMHAESWHNQLKSRKTGIHTTAAIDDVIYFLDDMEKRNLIRRSLHASMHPKVC